MKTTQCTERLLANYCGCADMCPLRPDIQYATKELTGAVQKPDEHDKQNAKHLLRYLHGTRNYKLHLKPKQSTHNDPYIKAYCDSDWA
eukprot:4062691-Amphidinium_carterae.1